MVGKGCCSTTSSHSLPLIAMYVAISNKRGEKQACRENRHMSLISMRTKQFALGLYWSSVLLVRLILTATLCLSLPSSSKEVWAFIMEFAVV